MAARIAKAINEITWDNAALISPATAKKHGLQNQEVVELRCNNRNSKVPFGFYPDMQKTPSRCILDTAESLPASRKWRGLRCVFNPEFPMRMWSASGAKHTKATRTQKLAVRNCITPWKVAISFVIASLEEYLKDPRENDPKKTNSQSVSPNTSMKAMPGEWPSI